MLVKRLKEDNKIISFSEKLYHGFILLCLNVVEQDLSAAEIYEEGEMIELESKHCFLMLASFVRDFCTNHVDDIKNNYAKKLKNVLAKK